ncbi:MAG: polysaccharide biosynthesis protein [Gemmatimonadota bacterium]|nr:polysaccharide biosynthesis protein [Gemmatimonadota bacterium]
MGEYGSRWRHVSFQDATRLAKAVTFSSVAFIGAVYFFGQATSVPRAIIFIDWMVTLLALVAAPSLVRALHERRRRRRGLGQTRRRTLVVGAGNAAAQIVHQLLRSPDTDIEIVGLVDDDRSKRFLRLHGLPVLGTTADLPTLRSRLGIDLIIVAIASSEGGAQIRRIVANCADLGVAVKIAPTLGEILRGEAPLSELRDVAPEALLAREPIDFRTTVVDSHLAGRCVLVTGAAGSIGTELVRQIADRGPGALILLDQAESPLVALQREIETGRGDVTLVPVVGDVTHRDTMEAIMRSHTPDVVFHAAAYKHVPVMESNVLEAVRNNVIGTFETAAAAARHGASRFVLISTDKAVRPSSVMGATKRVAERLVLGHPQLSASGTTFQAVRFGNVLGSAGSVVPLFQQQIAAGGPVTVTNPDMTRFFMTIPEAVQLVLLASSLPEARGRVSLLEMGAPVRILDMAEQLIRLSGFEPHTDIPITFTGTRPGEKLHEELMSDIEDTVPTVDERIRIVQTDDSEAGPVADELRELAVALGRRDEAAVLDRLVRMVPECVPPLLDRARGDRAGPERRLA